MICQSQIHVSVRIGTLRMGQGGVPHRFLRLFASAIGVSLHAIPTPGETPPGSMWWRFETEPGPLPAGYEFVSVPSGGPGMSLKGNASVEPGVPAPWIYDPAARVSVSNRCALRVGPGAGLEVAVPDSALTGSFTLEAYARPDADPRADAWLFFHPAAEDPASAFGAGLDYLPDWKQTYWSAFVRQPGAALRSFSVGPYTTIARLHSDTLGWRHLALVYDADRLTLSVYLDHWLMRTERLLGPLRTEGSRLRLGGQAGNGGWSGLIDEIRLTREALTPGRFLRAGSRPLRDVDFDSPETVLPRGTGFVDIRSGFGAVGDGVTDDTEAFQRAGRDLANKIPLAHYTLYVPPGTYLLSDTFGWSRYLTVWGAGRDRTILRLRDRAPAFQDPRRPRPVVKASSTPGPPGSNRQCNGSSMQNYLFDLTVDCGTDNRGAVGVEYHSNNFGTLARVRILGEGPTGLDLTHNAVGPCLIQDVEIRGFDVGIRTRYQEYSITLERVTVVDQRTAGLHNESNILAIRRLVSSNTCPAVISLGPASMITLLDSRLAAPLGSPEAAVVAEGGLYVRNLEAPGYARAILKRARGTGPAASALSGEVRETPGPQVDEFIADRVRAPFGDPPRSLGLPVEEPPEVPWGDIGREWISVRDFAHLKDGDDWTPAVQAALDTGRGTVYFPFGTYSCLGTVRWRSRTRRLFGMPASLSRPKERSSSRDPLLIFETPERDAAALIERLHVAGILHVSPAALTVRSCNPGWYEGREGGGPLFLEDVVCADFRFAPGQRVWARHWNVERHGEGPCIVNRGASLWALGFKTEYESIKLVAEDGAATEILGAFLYPVVRGIPPHRPMFRNTDSRLALVYGTSVYTADHPLHILDTQGDGVRETRSSDLTKVGSRFRMDLYVSGTDEKTQAKKRPSE